MFNATVYYTCYTCYTCYTVSVHGKKPGRSKLYYDENRIFPIEAILKHKKVVCMRRKMHFSFFLNISFRSRDIQVYEICKLAK